MAVTLLVFQIVAPVFILAGLGFVWVRAGWEYRVQFVTRLAMRLSLPCLIFAAMVKTELNRDLVWDAAIATLIAHIAIAAVFALLIAVTSLDRRTFLAPLTFGNTGNLGLPLALFAFGQTGLDIAVIVFAVSAILSFTFGLWVVSGGGLPTTMLKEPVVYGILGGAGFLYMDWGVPTWVLNTVELIGQMSIPLMLLTLGVAIGRLKPQSVGLTFALALLKAVVCAGIAWAVADWFALPETAFAVLVLQMTTPVAVTAYLLAESYGAKAEEVAGLVITSTLLSVAVLPLLLAQFV